MRTLKRAAISPIAVIWFTHDLALVAYRFGKRDASGTDRGRGKREMRMITDTVCVREQLAEAIREISLVRVDREHHPYGSTTAVETLPQVELTGKQVDVEIICDTLPANVRVPLVAGGVSFRCNCRLRSVSLDGKVATYEVQCE
jgi:hypothetical protein